MRATKVNRAMATTSTRVQVSTLYLFFERVKGLTAHALAYRLGLRPNLKTSPCDTEEDEPVDKDICSASAVHESFQSIAPPVDVGIVGDVERHLIEWSPSEDGEDPGVGEHPETSECGETGGEEKSCVDQGVGIGCSKVNRPAPG